jgi:hypothetical protein
MFYGYMNICEGGDYEKFKNKLKSEFLTSWFTSLTVWPIVLLGTFRYVPLYTQAPVINACCIVWDGFLSHRNSLARHKENQKASMASENEVNDDELELTLLGKLGDEAS